VITRPGFPANRSWRSSPPTKTRYWAPCGYCNRPLRYWVFVHCILQLLQAHRGITTAPPYQKLCSVFLVFGQVSFRCATSPNLPNTVHKPPQLLRKTLQTCTNVFPKHLPGIFYKPTQHLPHTSSNNKNIEVFVSGVAGSTGGFLIHGRHARILGQIW